MAAKSVLDVGIGLLDAVIEGNHLPRQIRDQDRGHFFPWQANCLCLGGRHGSRCNGRSVTHPGFGQDPGQPRNTALSNRFRALVARQQHHPATVRSQLGDLFQGRTDRDQLLAQSVDRAGAVSDQIGAMSGEHAQFGDQVIVGMQQWQIIAAHPGLISDHPGIFGIGLGLTTAVDGRRLPYRTARQVTHRLAGISQHRQQQGGVHGGQIHRPGHLITTQPVDFSDQSTDLLFVIDQPARQHHRAGVVDYAYPVMLFADINTSPQLARCHRTPFSLVCQHDPHGQPRQHFLKQAITSQISISSPRKSRQAGRPVLSSRTTRPATHMPPHPTHPGHSTT